MSADVPSLQSTDSSKAEQRYRTIQYVTIVGSIVDLLLGVGKIIGGWLAHSEALIADGVHSLSDLVTDIGVIIAARHARPNPDAEHPYGHARVENGGHGGPRRGVDFSQRWHFHRRDFILVQSRTIAGSDNIRAHYCGYLGTRQRGDISLHDTLRAAVEVEVAARQCMA